MDGVDYSPGPKPETPLPVLKTGKCLTTTGEIKIKDGFLFLHDEIVLIIKLFWRLSVLAVVIRRMLSAAE